ncbi:hypothetical protein MA16_Dca016444 [Dendrobium catenatum]|uniref:Uncharacterized protein n=1 Tax=Dendrobium catenatum TaxID=906689 RepID=A0A2I0VYN1_9ASPA|nr:hypothetical protein MA16_Dca016444 [Dendrobium catenatum]
MIHYWTIGLADPLFVLDDTRGIDLKLFNFGRYDQLLGIILDDTPNWPGRSAFSTVVWIVSSG